MRALIALLFLMTSAYAQVPSATTNYGIVGAKGVTPFDCSGTVTAGGTAQQLIPTPGQPNNKTPNIRGITIMNVDTATENLCISFTGAIGAATCATTGYYALAPATATVSGGSYSSPLGSGLANNIFVTATTTGHRFTCTYW